MLAIKWKYSSLSVTSCHDTNRHWNRPADTIIIKMSWTTIGIGTLISADVYMIVFLAFNLCWQCLCRVVQWTSIAAQTSRSKSFFYCFMNRVYRLPRSAIDTQLYICSRFNRKSNQISGRIGIVVVQTFWYQWWLKPCVTNQLPLSVTKVVVCLRAQIYRRFIVLQKELNKHTITKVKREKYWMTNWMGWMRHDMHI